MIQQPTPNPAARRGRRAPNKRLPPPTDYYTVEELAILARRSPQTVRSWVAKRKVGHTSIDRGLLIPKADVQRILDQNYVPALDRAV